MRHRPGGGFRAGGGCTPVERLGRPLLVERFTAVSALPRWCAPGGAGRAGGVGVPGALPASRAAVLWRCARCAARRQEAQAYPPGGERCEPAQGVGGARHAVVGAETRRQAECLARALTPGCGLRDARRGQGLATAPNAAVASGDGPRRAVAAVTGLDVSCAVGAPHRSGGTQVTAGLARRPHRSARALRGHSSVAAAEVTDGRACRPGPAGMACPADRHQLRGPPGRRPWSGFQDRRHHLVRRVVGRRAGPTGARFEALWAVGARAVDPCGPGLAADAGARAALGHGETGTQIIGAARSVLVQRPCVTPRQGAPPAWVPTSLVKLSPLSLDKTVTYVSGPYQVLSYPKHVHCYRRCWKLCEQSGVRGHQ